MKTLLKIVIIYISVWALIALLVVCALLIPPHIKQYTTSDINDYGHYIGTKDDQFTSEYINAFFPKVIEDTFTDVTYSYKAQNYAEYAFEAYLEFVIEDEKAFHEFLSAKTSGLESKVFSHDPNFVEYTLDDSLEIGVHYDDKNQISKIMIYDTTIGKILCNAEEHRIIFVAMALWDAWHANSDFFCCYFDRFHIDLTTYEGVRIR